MEPKKYRWSKVYESAEEELFDFLQARNIVAERHDLESYDTFAIRTNGTMRLWGVEGTAKLTVNDKSFSIQPGDVLALPAGAQGIIETTLSNFAWYQSA